MYRRNTGYTGKATEIDSLWELAKGNTYPIKDSLRRFGCKFGERDGIKGWYFDPNCDDVEEIRDALSKLPLPLDYSTWLPLLGNTYPIKDLLKKRFSARWSSEDRCWTVSPLKHKEAELFVQEYSIT
tara:strand:- start:363 stop:743 length:381 start_codon:yes stop_codon:yes gene_type:complete